MWQLTFFQRPFCSVSYFLDSPSRLSNECYFSRLLDIVRSPEGKPILEALSEAEGQLEAVFAPRPDAGELGLELGVGAVAHAGNSGAGTGSIVRHMGECLGLPSLDQQIRAWWQPRSSTACTSCTAWPSCCQAGCPSHSSMLLCSGGAVQSFKPGGLSSLRTSPAYDVPM